VLEGELEYRLGDIWTAAPAGSTVCVPRGVVHAFRNASDRPARHLVAHAPVAALELIEDLERVPQEAVEALLARHRTRLAGD
jgi:quercetin dioxygenase-like cupin family protein